MQNLDGASERIRLMEVESGMIIPSIAKLLPADSDTPANTIGVSPHPGWILRPDTTHAVVVMRGLGDAAGEPLGIPTALSDAWQRPETTPLSENFGTLYATLRTNDVAHEAVAAAFTTGDVAKDLYELSERTRDAYDATLSGLTSTPTMAPTTPASASCAEWSACPHFSAACRRLVLFERDGDGPSDHHMPRARESPRSPRRRRHLTHGGDQHRQLLGRIPGRRPSPVARRAPPAQRSMRRRSW